MKLVETLNARGPTSVLDAHVSYHLNAGVDLILVSYDPDQFYMVMYALIRAARAGVLRTDALGQSDQRLVKTWSR